MKWRLLIFASQLCACLRKTTLKWNCPIATNYKLWVQSKFLTLLNHCIPRSRLSRYSAACKRAAMLLIFLWTCWKSGVVLEINFKFLNLLQMFFAELLGLQKILFEVLVKWERVRREAKKLDFFFLCCEVLVEADVVSRMHAAFSDRVDISGVTRYTSEKSPKH